MKQNEWTNDFSNLDCQKFWFYFFISINNKIDLIINHFVEWFKSLNALFMKNKIGIILDLLITFGVESSKNVTQFI